VSPLYYVLILGGWVMVWTGVKGDGYGGYNPLNVIRDVMTEGRGKGGNPRATGVGNIGVDYVESGGPGVYEDFGPWNDPDGNHQGHGHFAGERRLVIAAGNALQEMGFSVAGHPLFPPIGVHGVGSHHYIAEAIDYNWPGPDERTQLARGRAAILAIASANRKAAA
jgi:hypothetical protein